MTRPETLLVTAGRPPRTPGGPLNPPVTLAAPFHAGVEADYARDAHPTVAALEEAVGALEGGEAVAFSSGMAAIEAVVATLVPVGGLVVAPEDCYSGTKAHLVAGAEEGRWRLEVADLSADPELPAGADLVWAETPSNPQLRITDLEAVAGQGAPLAVDSTFATPLGQQPLTLGAGVVVHSATKLLSGHSDLLCGVAVTADAELAERLRERRVRTGAVLGPFDAYLALRGLRTLAVRRERAQSTADLLATRLVDHPRVERVRYPGLPGHPGREVAARQMTGWGTMLTIEVAGGRQAALAAAEALEVAVHATSLGGVETTVDLRGDVASESHLPAGTLRVSVGLEDPEDLWADLDQALQRA